MVVRVALALIAVASAAQPFTAVGVAPGNAQVPHSFEVIFENDALHPGLPDERFSDREYTHGLMVASERNLAPVWGGLLPRMVPCSSTLRRSERCLQTRFEGGQKIYTPEIRDEIPSPEERPYAGWLYGSVTGRAVDSRSSRSLRAEVGVTGPLSMGESVQRLVHRVTGFPRPRGWDYQLGTELGVLAEYEERHLLERRLASGTRIADVILSSAATIGNVRTGIRGGVTFRAGHRLPHPWERSVAEHPLSVYGVGAFERSWTAHDLFLDGNTFRSSRSVERIATTDAVRIGTGVQFGDLRFTLTIVFEDPLYVTQPKPHRYSTLTLTVRP
jgi:lipid A 3-O-deacylase